MTDDKIDFESFDPDDFVSQFWPMPVFSEDRVKAATGTAAELMRWNCHALINSRDRVLPYPSSVGTVTSRLASTASGMNQVLGYLAERMEILAEEPALYDDRNPHSERLAPQHVPAETAQSAAAKLREAAALANQLMRVLGEAGGHLGRLGLRE
ncbi:hypothetical protein [Saccharothrix hoggarensis]|uniref:Uncharacterized protein n=1 Tax=Saccharothrix hoggarensis TaxID=913853 RepID=A0ABW3QDQ6_9PSEU